MKKFSLKSLSLAIGMAIAGTAGAGEIDWTGSNIYIKFLDGDRGNQDAFSTNGGPFDAGSDQGIATELELRLKADISKQVEAGARIKSRFNRNYWSENGGFANEGTPGLNLQSNQYMKLRGAYVNLTPGYEWLDLARIGSSDWGMFDPFTFGKMRYIDRDNVNGFYFKGPMAQGSWELARISLLPHLGANWKIYADTDGEWDRDESTVLFGLDRSYVLQLKHPLGGNADLTAIYEHTEDREKDGTDTTSYNGTDEYTRSLNTISGLKLDLNPTDWLEAKAAFYRSTYDFEARGLDTSGGPLPGDDIDDNAFKLNLNFIETGVDSLTFNYELFDIGAGYASVTAARRESDVLLSEGTESAWFNHGSSTWVGGSANEMQQVVFRYGDNENMDFDEPAAESVIGWKGHTLVANYEIADTPMSLEYSLVDFNTNWQNYDGKQSVYQPYGHAEDQDREMTIIAFKASHVFDVAGGLQTNFKYKTVDDEDTRDSAITTDTRETKDKGYSIEVGNQLSNDLYGSIAYGIYTRDVTDSGSSYDNDKDIISLRFNYNLAGFEAGMLTQWINGDGDPNQDGTPDDLKQYRLKFYAQVLF